MFVVRLSLHVAMQNETIFYISASAIFPFPRTPLQLTIKRDSGRFVASVDIAIHGNVIAKFPTVLY